MRYIAGFAQACWVSATDFLALGSQLTVTEEALLQQINTEGEATMDCDGCDLRLKDQLQRIQFAGFAADVQAVRDELAALAQRVQGE
jgi:hypothetical protein